MSRRGASPTGEQKQRLVAMLGGTRAVVGAARDAGAVSLFAYGSQARGDWDNNSDIELGVVVDDQSTSGPVGLVQRALRSAVPLRVYGFSASSLADGDPEVPFTRAIFCAELRLHSVTLTGVDVRSMVPAPLIDVPVLMEEHAFIRARMLDAFTLGRSGHVDQASELASKMSYMAARLVLLASEHALISSRRDLRASASRDDIAGLAPWFSHDYCTIRIREDPESVRELIGMMSRPILNAVRHASNALIA